MAQLRYYVVTRTMDVRVSATNSTDAISLAKRVFDKEKHPEDQMDVQSWPRETGLSIREVERGSN